MEPLASTPILIDQVYDRLMLGDCRVPAATRPAHPAGGFLAASLGVSRQPVSHALQLLKRQRLVEDVGRKGLQVAPIDRVAIRNLYQLRSALDSLATRLAAERVARGEADAAARSGAELALAQGMALGPDVPIRPLSAPTWRSIARSTASPAIPRSRRRSRRNGRI